MRVILTVLFTASTLLSMGQYKPGLLGTLDNQLIGGFIQVTGTVDGTQLFQFKETASSEPVEYRPEQVASYQVIGENAFYSGAIVESGDSLYFFFERIVIGKLQLYTFLDRFVFNTENAPFKELTSTNYKDLLSLPLTDCPYTSTSLSKLKFSRTALVKVFTQYNECHQSPNPQTFIPRKTVALNYTVLVGLDQSTVAFESSTTSPPFSGQSLSNLKPLTFGGLIWLGFKALPEQLQVVFGLNYSPRHYNGVSHASGTDYANNISFTEFQFPIRLQYRVVQGNRLSGFVSAGTSFSVIQGFESSQIWDVLNGSSIYINEIAPFTNLNKGIDLYGGLGATMQISKMSKVLLLLSYTTSEASFANGTNSPAKANFGTLSLSAGFQF